MAFKIYTRTGDAGESGLFGGQRVRKDDARLEAYGTVDELNSSLGVLLAEIRAGQLAEPLREDGTLLIAVQSNLFTVGAQLATPDGKPGHLAALTDEAVAELEAAIDRLDAELPPLTSFVLPGGPAAAGWAHVARTVARRAERRVVTLASVAEVDPVLVRYLNRLSDYLFTLARRLTHASGEAEQPWEGRSA